MNRARVRRRRWRGGFAWPSTRSRTGCGRPQARGVAWPNRWAAARRRGWARRSGKFCASWWRPTIMPLWPNRERGFWRRPGSASAGRCCASPSSVSAWCVKKTLRASEQGRADVVAERAAFAAAVKTIAPEDLVFLDETGVSTRLTRLYARAPRGRRAYGTAPGHWHRLTVLGALTRGGLVAVMTVPAATDWPVFEAFLQQVVIPSLRYSPEFNPIELCWSKLKTPLRTAAPRSIAAIEEQIGPALDTITPQDAKGWFRHCGYPASS